MILKFIQNNFELDLVNFQFAMVEENNWFTDQLFTKYTYPLEMELTDEQDAALGYLTEQNIELRRSLFEGRFYANGEDHEAVLEIERITGRVVTAQIRYGFEELPNANKKLSELALDDFALVSPATIFSYANSIIDTTWPTHNFCFPKIWTDRINTEEAQWAAFQGAINNYISGAMLINEYDEPNDLQINRNIIQPMPFLLHVLTKGFEDAGYELAGDILTDPEFIKAFIYHFSDYYFKTNDVSDVFNLTTNQYQTLVSPIFAEYEEAVILPEPGRYKFAGNIVLRAKRGSNPNSNPIFGIASAKFEYNGAVIWENNLGTYRDYEEKFKTIEFVLDFYGSEGNVDFTSVNLPFAQIDETIDSEAMIADITITQLTKFDVNGNPLPSLVIPNEIKLTKCVPDMTFGKLFEICRKWKNFDLVLEDGLAKMNYITKEVNTSSAKSLKEYEVEFPERIFNEGKSFVLKFQDVNTEGFPEYEYHEVFVDASGFVQSPFTKKDETEETVIDAVVLPLKTNNSHISAHDFLSDTNRLYIGMYNGLVAGNNRAMDPRPLMIPLTFQNYYREWFEFLLRTINYNWNFLSHPEKLQRLKVKSVIYAYQNYHLIERISRSNVTPELIYTEIETKTLI